MATGFRIAPPPSRHFTSAMRITILFTGIAIISLGFWSTTLLSEKESIAYLQGALTLGGGLLICAAFTIRMPWHGIIGAGILALLGFVRGLGNLPKLVTDQPHTSLPFLELAITVLTASLFARVIVTLLKEKSHRSIQSLRDP